jgi:hypothetical protein
MADDKIDPALVQLARQHPDCSFAVDGVRYERTSTCAEGELAARRLIGGHDLTSMLHADVYQYCIDSTGLPRKNVIADAAALYGRSERQIERMLEKHELSTIPRSTDTK